MLADGWGGLTPSEIVTEKLSATVFPAKVVGTATATAEVVKGGWFSNPWSWVILVVALLVLVGIYIKGKK